MFTRIRVLAGAAVVGALAIAAPVASASAATIPTARATLGASAGLHGYGGLNQGYGNGYGSWSHGNGYGSWNHGNGYGSGGRYGYGMPGPSAPLGGRGPGPGLPG